MQDTDYEIGFIFTIILDSIEIVQTGSFDRFCWFKMFTLRGLNLTRTDTIV